MAASGPISGHGGSDPDIRRLGRDVSLSAKNILSMSAGRVRLMFRSHRFQHELMKDPMKYMLTWTERPQGSPSGVRKRAEAHSGGFYAMESA